MFGSLTLQKRFSTFERQQNINIIGDYEDVDILAVSICV